MKTETRSSEHLIGRVLAEVRIVLIKRHCPVLPDPRYLSYFVLHNDWTDACADIMYVT